MMSSHVQYMIAEEKFYQGCQNILGVAIDFLKKKAQGGYNF